MKILIWGTGKFSNEILKKGISGEIIGFIESKKEKDFYKGIRVYSSDEIPEPYDFILVASTYINDIYKRCISLKVNMDRIIFLLPKRELIGVTNLNSIRQVIGERNFTDYCIRVGTYKNTFFEKDLFQYKKLNRRESFEARKENYWPIITDKYEKAGTMHNYFWQDLWAAKKIYKNGTKYHFDIGSRIDGFIAHLLSMDIDVTVIDIREFPGEVENLHTIVDDATSLKNIKNESIKSMSALCSLEHFGLGRYGDKIDPEACFNCFQEIQKRIASGGNLYISLPVGKERVEFNAHRVFYPSTVVECFHEMKLMEFSCTYEGKIEYDVAIHKYDNDPHDGEYRYGLFHFRKV